MKQKIKEKIKLKMTNIYKVIKCSSCGTLQSTSAKTRWKCINCNYNKNISDLKIFFKSNNPKEVTQFIQNIKSKENKNYDGFFNYK